MRKLKISFEIDNSWERGDFRQFIEELNKNDTVELFLMTISTDEDLIDSVQSKLDLDDDHVIQVATNVLKLNSIEDNAIRIHFDSDVEFAKTLYDVIGIYGIYSGLHEDIYHLRMKYVTEFNFILKQIQDEERNC